MSHLLTMVLFALTTASTRNVPASSGSVIPRRRSQTKRRRTARR
jgi:hypothetical protein